LNWSFAGFIVLSLSELDDRQANLILGMIQRMGVKMRCSGSSPDSDKADLFTHLGL